jgi:hypothetical protein
VTGTALACGLALASVAVGPATAADLGRKIIHDGDLNGDSGKGKHDCNVIGAVINSGTVTNNCIRIGTLNNSGAGAVVTNFGTWIGDLLSNIGGATVKNVGTWTGDANNASTVVNSGTWNTTAHGFTNSGTLITTGTLNATLGGLINTGIVDARGLIRGNIANAGSGVFTVTGPLSAGSGTFLNGSGAVLNVGANTFSDIGTLTNGAGGIVNLAGGTIGAITTVNAGALNASGLSTINGALTNSSLINLQNNVAGDRLTVTGNFTGPAGSTIALDINAKTGIADQIVINGSATGSTTLNVAGLAPGNPFAIGPNLVVVHGATSANAFVLGNVVNFGTFNGSAGGPALRSRAEFRSCHDRFEYGAFGVGGDDRRADGKPHLKRRGVRSDVVVAQFYPRRFVPGRCRSRHRIRSGIRQGRSGQPLRAI